MNIVIAIKIRYLAWKNRRDWLSLIKGWQRFWDRNYNA